jgi:hypothetical protein
MKGKTLRNTVLVSERRKKLNLVAECNGPYLYQRQKCHMRREREATTDEVVLKYPALFITVILADAFLTK